MLLAPVLTTAQFLGRAPAHRFVKVLPVFPVIQQTVENVGPAMYAYRPWTLSVQIIVFRAIPVTDLIVAFVGSQAMSRTAVILKDRQ